MFHVISASAALQTASEYFLKAFLSCAKDLMYSKSSFLLKVNIGKSLSIDFALLISFCMYIPIFCMLMMNIINII